MPIGIDMNNYDISMGTGQIRMSGGGGGLAGNVYINGNVGIGVINPKTRLDVNGKISSNAEICVGGTPNAGNSGGYRLLRLTPVSGTATQITFDTSISTGTGQNYIYSDNTIMEIKSPLTNFTGGSVGIGTTTPVATLDVAGDIKCNSTIRGAGLNLYLATGAASGGNAVYMQVNNTNITFTNSTSFAPETDNSITLGASVTRWTTVFATNGTINTSDIREKTNIHPTNLGLQFIRKLNPVSYKWKIGQNMVDTVTGEITPREGIRTFYGLLAQEVKQTIDELGTGDFAGWTLEDVTKPESIQGLRYTEFICPLIKAVQEQQTQIEQQQTILEQLQQRIQALENK